MKRYLVVLGEQKIFQHAKTPEQAFEVAFKKYVKKDPTRNATKALAKYWATGGQESNGLPVLVAPVCSDGLVGAHLFKGCLLQNKNMLVRAKKIMKEQGISPSKIETNLEERRLAAIQLQKEIDQERTNWEWSKP